LKDITADDVREWYGGLNRDTPTMRAHCYGLLRAILNTAVIYSKIGANPCVIRGAGSVDRQIVIRPATLDQVTKLVDAMPDRYKLMVLLASWCALRFGELAELRRKDVDIEEGVIRVQRGVVRLKAGFKPTTTKSGRERDVNIPPHLMPAVKAHLIDHVAAGPESLLFPAHSGGHLATSTMQKHYYKAREAAGRPDLWFHDLRHTGSVLAAASGATLAELMARLGHTSVGAALRYMHASEGADKRIATALSKLATP
jgi:integrase